jgi:hypothetical protein
MADSYRLTVLKRLGDLLSQITIANGFEYDLSAAVHRGRTTFGDSDPLPMLSLIEATQAGEGVYAAENNTLRKGDWPLILQGWVDNDLLNPTDPAYGLMAAVEVQLAKVIEVDRATGDPKWPEFYLLGTGDSWRSNLITSISFGPGIVSGPREQMSSNAFFYMPITVGLAEKLGQPYLS